MIDKRLSETMVKGGDARARYVMRGSWIAALIGLAAFYYALPQLQLEMNDSRYVLATADLLLRTGSLDMRPLVRADKQMPLTDNPQLLARASDLAPEIVAAVKAAGLEPFGKSGAIEYFFTYDLFKNIPVPMAEISLATVPPVSPLFPTWPSFAAMPVSLVTAALGIPVFDGALFHEDRNELYQKIVAALLVAAAVVFFYAAALCLLTWPFALGLAAWLAVGLFVSNTSRALWSDSFALPLSFAGLYIFVRTVVAGRLMPYWPVMLAAALSFAFMMKSSYAIPSAMMGLLVLLAPKIPPRMKATFVAGCAIFAALFVVTSFWIYGNPLPPYFAPSRVGSSEPSHLAGVLFSPGRGILWFTPSLLVACCAPFLAWRDRRFFVASIVAVAAVAASVLTVGKFPHWWGGGSFGPRLLQFALPAAALLALVVVHAASLRSGRERITILTLCCAIAGWEGFVHLSGVISPRGWMWNGRPVAIDAAPQRLWDWSNPQFLAAYLSTRPAEDTIDLPRDGWVRMASPCSDHFAGEGFSAREAEFRWTEGGHAELLFAAAPENASHFAIEVAPLIDARHPAQRVSVAINGAEIGAAALTEPKWTQLQFDAPPGLLKSFNTIALSLPDAHPPEEGSRDQRRLGVAVRSFILTAEPDVSSPPIAQICR